MTLVELMTVVAVLALIAMIGYQHFMHAHTRAKLARVKADFRAVYGVIEAYRLDHNAYVPDVPGGGNWVEDVRPFAMMTTPIAYITSIPASPFDRRLASTAGNYAFWGNPSVTSDNLGVYYHVISTGPDGSIDLYFDTLVPELVASAAPAFKNMLYDPSNGTMSNGDLHLSNRGISF